jgi:hypothetical protein
MLETIRNFGSSLPAAERRVERADVDARMLDQGRHLVQQRLVLAEAGALARRLFLEEFFNLTATRIEARDDHAGGQPGFVLVRVRERDLARAHEAVAARAVARLQPQHRPRNDVRSVQHHQPMHRPHELRVARSPAHHLRDRQLLQCRRHHVGKNAVKGNALLDGLRHDDFSLGRVLLHKGIHRDAMLVRKSGKCGSGG